MIEEKKKAFAVIFLAEFSKRHNKVGIAYILFLMIPKIEENCHVESKKSNIIGVFSRIDWGNVTGKDKNFVDGQHRRVSGISV